MYNPIVDFKINRKDKSEYFSRSHLKFFPKIHSFS